MKWLRVSSLRDSLILTVVLATLPPLAFLLYQFQEERKIALQQVGEDARRMVDLLEAHLQKTLEGAFPLLAALSLAGEARGGESAACDRMLAGILKQSPQFHNLGVTRRNGEVWCSGLPFPPGLNLADRTWFQRALESRDTVVGDLQVSRATGQATIVLARAILDDRGEPKAVVSAAIELKWLPHLGGLAKLPPQAMFLILDRQGAVLARHPDEGNWMGKSPPPAPLTREILSRHEGTGDFLGLDGQERVYAFRPLGGDLAGQLYLAVGLTKESVLFQANRIFAFSLMILGLIALGSLLIARYLGEVMIVRKAAALIGASNRLAGGDLGARAGLAAGAGEFGHLARAFDRMAEALEKREKERKETEERLKENEKKYQDLYEEAPLAYFTVGSGGKILLANRSAESMLGYSRDELIGRPVLDLYADTPRGKEKAAEVFKKFLEGREIQGEELEMRSREGEPAWISLTVRPVLGPDGKARESRCLAVNITARKRAEEELQKSQAILEGTFASLDQAVFVVDPATRSIAMCNSAVERIFGHGREESIGRTTEFLHVSRQAFEEFGRRLFPALDREGVFRTEYRMKRKDGSVFFTEITVTELKDQAGKRAGVVSVVRDISDRKRAEAALLDSEERYRHLVEMSPDAIGVHQDGKVVFANPSGIRMFGAQTPEEIVGKPIQGLVHPDHFPAARERIRRMLGGEKGLYPVEDCYLRVDGTPFWVEVTAAPFTYRDRPAVLVVARDVSERKAAELQLRETERRLRLAATAGSVGLWDWDLRTNQVYYSPEWKRQIGYGDREISNDFSEWESRVHPEDLAAAVRTVRAYLEKPWPDFQNEFRFRHKDGSYRWILAQASLLFDEEGKPRRMLGSHIDITARKRTELALGESEERFRRALENIPDVIVLYDRELRIRYINAATRQITGRPASDFIGKREEEIWPPEVYRPYMPTLLEAVKTRAVRSVETDLLIPETGRHSLMITCVPLLDEQGHVREVLGITHDFTERKRAEERLKAYNEQLRSLSARLQEIREDERAGIAREIHDVLGQGLTALKMDLSLLKRRLLELRDPLVERAQSMSEMIDEAIETTRKICSELRPGVLDDLGLAAAIEWQAQEFQDRTGIGCEFVSSIEGLELDRESSTAVFRIFQEALTNIARHAQATRVFLVAEEEKGQMALRIEDNGRGISPEEIRDSSSLGILGMRERAHVFGGEVIIEGRQGKGTRVSVMIPLASPGEKGSRKSEDPGPAKGPRGGVPEGGPGKAQP